ncbi:MAG: hypothetical protein K2Q25_09900 [Mycobacteriaceae bacterium]|nr:hypothetical protein [Mycobacteriaceae bacterium]
MAPVFAVDLPDVVEWLSHSGIPAVPLTGEMSGVAGAVVAVSAKAETVGLAQRSEPGVRKLRVVQAVHGGDSATVRYTIMQLLSSDPLACVRRQEDIAAAIKSSGRYVQFTGVGAELHVQFPGRAGLMRLGDPIIKPGESLGAAHFFEIGLTNPGADKGSVFQVNGRCRARGMIAARDQKLSTAPEPAEWGRCRCEIARLGVDLRIQDNQLVECVLDGRDISADIARWTGMHGLGITECSIGVNPQVLADVDWSLNSVMNEGAQGIHIGFGLYDGMHFDFICPEVGLVSG